MKSWLHYRRPKFDLEEQKRSVEIIYFHPNLIYWKRGPYWSPEEIFRQNWHNYYREDWAAKIYLNPGWKIRFMQSIEKSKKSYEAKCSWMGSWIGREILFFSFILNVVYHLEVMRTLWIDILWHASLRRVARPNIIPEANPLTITQPKSSPSSAGKSLCTK